MTIETGKNKQDEERKIQYQWIENCDRCYFNPITLISGVCFNNKGRILVMHEFGKWRIPGGSPEHGESIEDTLRRELRQEVNVTVDNIYQLGAYKRTGILGNAIDYQLVLGCQIVDILARELDPEAGVIHEYRFMELGDSERLIGWKEGGCEMFKSAKRWYQSI